MSTFLDYILIYNKIMFLNLLDSKLRKKNLIWYRKMNQMKLTSFNQIIKPSNRFVWKKEEEKNFHIY